MRLSTTLRLGLLAALLAAGSAGAQQPTAAPPDPPAPETPEAPAPVEELRRLVAEQRAQIEALRRRNEELERQLEEQRRLLEEQQRILQALEARLAQLEAAPPAAAPPAAGEAPPVVAAAKPERVEDVLENPPEAPTKVGDETFPDSFPIPGTKAALRIGGFVKMVGIGNLAELGTDDRFIVSSIPTSDEESFGSGQRVTLTARQSRINFDFRESTSAGQLRAFVEADFFGVGNNLRLRHAFGQFRRFLAGQTWSTLADPRAQPEEVDFEGLNSAVMERQAQVRYVHPLRSGATLAVALEDPAPDVTGGAGVSESADVIVRWRREGPRGHLQLGSILRNVRAQDLADATVTDGSTGWGISATGLARLTRWDPRDNLVFGLTGGDGIGRYLTDLATLGGQDGVFDSEAGRIETLPVFGAYVGLQHWWKPRKTDDFSFAMSRWWHQLLERANIDFESFRSTLVYGYTQVDNLDTQPDDAYYRAHRVGLSLIWSPAARIDLGTELLWGAREDKDGDTGDAVQLQLGATYRF